MLPVITLNRLGSSSVSSVRNREGSWMIWLIQSGPLRYAVYCWANMAVVLILRIKEDKLGMLFFVKQEKRLVLSYTGELSSSNWIYSELAKRNTVTLRKTFTLSSSEL